ncbi:MAG: MlaD family protein [Bryobacteraceae bacterium]|nr:MlaD family protein [Bryobacteraceae bacterium]MDW8379122.1 MlaD family protein [Bryobacterales bacterium]
MPSPSKITWMQLRVGITAIFALSLIGVLVFLLTGVRNPFAREVVIYTYLGDGAAVAVGAPVRINGINAGNVANIGLSGDTNPMRIVRVEMAVEERMLKEIPVDSVATISAENLLGAKFINIKKGKSQTFVKPGAEIASLASKEIFEIMDSFFPLLTSVQVTLKRIDNIVDFIESGQGNIGKLIKDETLYKRIDNILAEFQKTSAAVNDGKSTISRLLYEDALYQDIRGSLSRVDRILAGIEKGEGTAGKLLRDPAIYDELQKNLLLVRALLEDLQAGKGTAGKLLKSEELHNQIAGLMRRVDTTLEKINSGQGTLGQLLVNPQLYEQLNLTSREVTGLLKDFRANPKKFLHIKLGLF